MKKNKVKQSIKQEKGAITSYVLLSMLFFLVVISGIYFNTNNKMQKQEKEINKIQQEYQKNNPEEMYVQAQNNSTSVDAPSIQIYDGDILKKEITGEKTNSKKTVYLLSNKVTLKFLSKSINNKYAYSTEENGEKTKLKEDRLDTEVTTSGKTLYVYTINEEGKYSQYYTAVTLILVKVELNPNGGTFTMPTTGTATIKTTVKAENANKIEVTWSDKEEYKEINNNEQVIKTDCTEGKYYLYVRINGEEIFKSQEFNVGQNTLDSNKIKITPNTTNWTNQLTAVIEYGSTLTVNQKAGYGTTLKAAVAAANTSTSSNLTTTANGYFYAEATDTAGNKVTASFGITNIDTTKPVVTSATPSTNSVRIKATDNAAGIVGYAITTSTTAPTAFTKCDSTKSLDVTVDGLKQGTTYYAWVKDAAGNVSEGKSTATVTVAGLEIKVNTTNWSTSKTITITAVDSNYSNIRYTTDGTIPTSTTGTTIASGGTFTITSNCTITAVAFDSAGQAGSAATNKITKIDTEAPNVFTPTVASTTNSITVTAQTSDKKATITNGESGIEGYRFSKDNGKTWTEYQENGEYTFNDMLKSIDGSTYDIVVQAKDKAQNVVSTKIKASTTKNMDYYIAEKNMLLCTFMPEGYTRDFYKYNDGGAIAAIQYTKFPEDAPDGIGRYKWYNPMLVSTKSENVIYYARNRTGEESGVNPKWYGQFVYKDVTYYYSSGTWSVPEVKNYITTLKLLNVNDQPFIETTVEYRTAAIALIKKYLGE